jgi:hypothetical protein
MTERFHTPPHTLHIESHTPLVFLAGPVQGAPNWHSPIADELLTFRDDIHVASPRRLLEDEIDVFTANDSQEQVEWENAALERSAKFGSIVVWFAAQDHSLPYRTGRAYAQTTRLELGEAWGWLTAGWQFPLVVGFDPNYTFEGGGSESYVHIKQRLKKFPIYHSLDDIVSHVIEETPIAY